MTIQEYLSLKYQTPRPTVITYREARILGVPWPLQKGWLAKVGKWQIRPTQARELGWANRDRKADTTSARAARYSQRGIDASKHAAAQAAWKPQCVEAARDDFLQTYEWRRVRMEAIKKYGRRCQCCGAGPDTAKLHVDHIKPRKLFPMLALDIENLQILCEECNHGKGNWDMTDWRDKVQDEKA